MKKAVLVLIVLCSATITFSRIGLGVDVWYNLSIQVDEDKDTGVSIEDEKRTDTDNNLTLYPRLVIMPTEKLELSPFILFGLASSKEKRKDESGTNESKRTQFTLGAGLGIYFHLIRREIINLSIGPELTYSNIFKPIYDDESFTDYDSYLNMSIAAGAPVQIDFHITDAIHLRLSSNIITVSYMIYKYERFGKINSNKWFDLDFKSFFSPSFGIFFLF